MTVTSVPWVIGARGAMTARPSGSPTSAPTICSPSRWRRRARRCAASGRRRLVTGAAVALLGLAAADAAARQHTRDRSRSRARCCSTCCSVVVVAVIGGMAVALASAIAAAFLINYFFVKPEHTLHVAQGEQALALVVFLIVAAVVSGAVELAARRARAAERAARRRETLSAWPARRSRRAATRCAGSWTARARRSGWSPSRLSAREHRVRRLGRGRDRGLGAAGRGGAASLRRADRHRAAADRPRPGAVRRGPARAAGVRRGGADRLRGPATAASAPARRASSPRPTASAPRCSRPWATTCAPRSPGSRRRSARCARPTWTGRTSERGELLATIEESADRLDAIVANLLDASRLQAGALSVQARAGGARRGDRRGAAAPCRARADACRSTCPRTCRSCSADPGLLERVLANLLENAIRHGGGGPGRGRGADRRARRATSKVVDHGPGVPADQREGLFQPFQRARRRHPPGRRARPHRRARVRGGDGRRADRRRLGRRRPDDAAAAARSRRVTRVLIVDDEPRDPPGAVDQPARARLRGRPPWATGAARSPRPRSHRPTS